MMPVRNGLLSTLRAKGRTALFVLLILVLTVALSLGLGMWAYCDGLLGQMEEQFTSMALVEYMGENYPDADAADENARAAFAALDDAALSAVDGVKLWERAESTFISIEGGITPNRDSPYRNCGVVVATMKPEYTWGMGPVAEEDMPEERCVFDWSTEDLDYRLTFYHPDLEPLSLAYYWQREDGRFMVQGTGEILGSEEDLLTPRLVLSSYGGRMWRGQLPEGWDWSQISGLYEDAFYEYDAHSDTYWGPMLVLDDCSGRVSRAVYTSDGKESFLCYFRLPYSGFVPEEGKRYLLHGEFVTSYRGGRTFQVMDFPGSDELPWLEIESNDDPATEEGIFAEYAQRYRLANNASLMTVSDNIPALEPFQQGTLFLDGGRFPQPGEAGACVLSGSTAELMGLGVGDTLELEVLRSEDHAHLYVSPTGDRRTLEIVGLTNRQSDYAGQIWVSSAEGGFGAPLFGYTLGTATLDNAKAVEAEAALSALLPPTTRVTLYDQGYGAAARPIQAMRTAAEAITAASACGALAVLVLFAFLFVGRQRETVGVLVSLGTPVGKIRAWLLSGAAAVSGVAALLGALIGSLALDRVTLAALQLVDQLYTVDTRYSEAVMGLVKNVKTTGDRLDLPLWPAPAAGAAVFLAALVLCLIFLRHARKENAPKQGKVSVRVPRGSTSCAGRGSLRFAALSARRGGRRSAVVVAAALVLTLFLSVLAANAQGWSRRTDELYADSRLTGKVVSLNGRIQSGLVIPIRDVQALWRSDCLEEISASISWHYWVQNEALSFVGGGFGAESQGNWIAEQPTLSAVNSLSAAGEFCYTDRPEVQWLDGWDESFLADPDYPSVMDSVFAVDYGEGWEAQQEMLEYVWPVLASSRFLESRGMELGDTQTVVIPMEFYMWYGKSSVEWPVKIQVVGSFAAAGNQDNLYAPLALWCGPEWLRGEGNADLSDRPPNKAQTMDDVKKMQYFQTNFDVCRFTLRSAYELEDLRSYLVRAGFSQVRIRSQRATVVLRDQNFVEAVGGLSRYISFSRILFPVLFLVVGLMGFIISWLTVSSRRMELAIMRGLGASPGRTFASFFLEQAALCLAGCLAGVLAMTLLDPGGAVWLAGAGFLTCYLAGCALSVAAAGKTNLMLLLSERE